MKKVLYYTGQKGENQIGGLTVGVRVEDEHGVLNDHFVRHVERHSPDGFQWGYGGSGPADLALSILTHFVKFDSPEYKDWVESLYQKFKWEFIAHAKNVLFIDGKSIRDWLKINAQIK